MSPYAASGRQVDPRTERILAAFTTLALLLGSGFVALRLSVGVWLFAAVAATAAATAVALAIHPESRQTATGILIGLARDRAELMTPRPRQPSGRDEEPWLVGIVQLVKATSDRGDVVDQVLGRSVRLGETSFALNGDG